VAALAHAAAFVADRLGIAGSHVARHKITEGWILALQEIVALIGRDIAGSALVALGFRDPDAAVVAQRFAHQRELRLILAGHRNARGMNLREARIGEQRSMLVGAPAGRDIAALRVGGKIIDVAVSTGGEYHGIGPILL